MTGNAPTDRTGPTPARWRRKLMKKNCTNNVTENDVDAANGRRGREAYLTQSSSTGAIRRSELIQLSCAIIELRKREKIDSRRHLPPPAPPKCDTALPTIFQLTRANRHRREIRGDECNREVRLTERDSPLSRPTLGIPRARRGEQPPLWKPLDSPLK